MYKDPNEMMDALHPVYIDTISHQHASIQPVANDLSMDNRTSLAIDLKDLTSASSNVEPGYYIPKKGGKRRRHPPTRYTSFLTFLFSPPMNELIHVFSF